MAKKTTKLSPREEYDAALADLNRYSDNNQTPAALKARARFEKADRARRWCHR